MQQDTTFPLTAALVHVVNFGAVGDGGTSNTQAIRKAIDACAAQGGGTVYFPAGRFLTGPIELKSDITLHLDAGATLLFSMAFDDYPTVRARSFCGEWYAYCPLILGRNLSNIAITGRGTIDGQGDPWWALAREHGPYIANFPEGHPVTERAKEFATLNEAFRSVDGDDDGWRAVFARPPLIQLHGCSNVLFSGTTHCNSPGTNTNVQYCDNVCVEGVTFLNPPHAPNGDGLNIDSSKNVRVSNCYFRVKDDCLCLKSGRDEDGRRAARPTETVTVTNCVMDRGHGGVVMGSEMSGGIRDIVISNCIFNDEIPRGLRIKSNRRRGGVVEDIRANNIIMKNVEFLITMHAYYGCGVRPEELVLVREDPQPVSEKTPVLRNVQLSHITARGIKAAAGYIHGLPEMPIGGISLNDVIIEMTDDPQEQGLFPSLALENHKMAGEGFFLKHARDVSFRDVTISTRQGPSLCAKNVKNIDVAGLRTARPHAGTPLIDFENVSGALVDQCRMPGTDAPVLKVGGSSSAHIVVAAEREDAVSITGEVHADAVTRKGG